MTPPHPATTIGLVVKAPAKPSAETLRHETVAELHRLLVRNIVERCGLNAGEAAGWADTLIEALQEHAGGERLGPRGCYIPAPNRRIGRDERIRQLAGPGPHTRTRVRSIALQMDCSVATVWRAIRNGGDDQGD